MRNINFCFRKMRLPGTYETASSSSSSSNPEDQNRPLPTTSSAKTALNLVKNFNSLYDDSTTSTSKSIFHSSSGDEISDSDADTATPDFAAVFASRRLFFSSPGRSNSIVGNSSPPSSSSSLVPPESESVVGGGVAVPTYSPDPYIDFRRSMQEMVEARDLLDVRANWDYLHELLTCYLELNPKSTHKYIVGAFSDLLVTLLTSPPAKIGGRESEISGGGCSFSGQCS